MPCLLVGYLLTWHGAQHRRHPVHGEDERKARMKTWTLHSGHCLAYSVQPTTFLFCWEGVLLRAHPESTGELRQDRPGRGSLSVHQLTGEWASQTSWTVHILESLQMSEKRHFSFTDASICLARRLALKDATVWKTNQQLYSRCM